MEIITGYTGKPHVTAEQDRDVNEGIFDTGSFVLKTGSQLAAELVSNNEIKVRDGVLVIQGCTAVIKKNTYDPVTIANGSQGMKRIDLIVARYNKNEETKIEEVMLKVIQGTPNASTAAVPTYKTGDIQSGDLVADMPLYKVTLDGLNVTSVDKMFTVIPTLPELSSKLTKANNDITAINNIIKNVEIKKTNLKVAANSDFRWTWDLPTISGYYPLEVLTWNFQGDYDLWLNVSTAARYSTSNQFGIEGHNFGNGAATVTLYVHILYVKNGFGSYVKA
ncbi:MAG: hypothetical protein ACLVB7_05585 [Coprococcus comes]